ncbi:MAG TPA: tetratricopeptide repeat protein [Pyrinomonadaceae bacterium]|jgi:tetratricopeptide (TPR) repeat protein
MMRVSSLLLATFLFCSATATTLAQQPGGNFGRPGPTGPVESTNLGSIRGRVLTPDGRPTSEAVKITLEVMRGNQIVIYSDQQGQFEVKGLAPGAYLLEADASMLRLGIGTERVQVYRGTPAIATIYLKEKGGEERRMDGSPVISVGELDGKVPSKALKEFNRASDAMREGKNEEAVAFLQKAIAIYPDYLKAHNDLGTCLLALGKLDDAEKELRIAIGLDAKAFNPQLNLGIVLVNQQKFAEAAETLDKALALGARSPAARLYSGIAFTGLGNTARGEKDLKAAYEFGGAKFAVALFHLGQLYMNEGKNEEALEAFETYLREAPDANNLNQVRQFIAMLRRN